MVSEIRQIVFSNKELIYAIVDFDRNHKKRLPRHKVIGCTLRSNPTVAILAFDTAWQEEKSADLDASSLAAVLIYACSVHGIPLPKRAEKTVNPIGDSLALDFSIATHASESDFEERSRRWDLEGEPVHSG